ncbi:MAG: acyl-CoA dehydrogenase [Lentisphaerae bacterium]|nr:acyl-CoA dehydrogenase [Lentisphaerota bacterium]
MTNNYFTDNSDLQFHLQKETLQEIAALREENYQQAKKFPGAPRDFSEALSVYQRKLSELGAFCAEEIAPRATQVDRDGAVFADGQVTYAPGTIENLRWLAKEGLMGVTLPREVGGLNMPSTIYTMMTEIVSRADASLQNLFGLQSIAETINRFGDQQQREHFLPTIASGKADGAMVLTEPEAGSDLQSVQTTATFDAASGKWFVDGHKHFITNGCASVLLVLARSEPDTIDGRGLSLFLVEKCPEVVIKSIEDKLGLRASPTCELIFNHAPALLIGQRRRGLTRYVMSLMNGARLAIAAQAVGLAEAAFRTALEYTSERQQFGKPLRQLGAVSEMLTRMKVDLLAGRTLLYETCKYVDLRDCYEYLNSQGDANPENREKEKSLGKIAAVLTPMTKAFNTEMCNQACYDCIQCHGGKGYMRTKLPERYYRDARITNIYEGTTQLQIVAAIGGVMQRTLDPLLDELAALAYSGRLAELASEVAQARKLADEAVTFVEQKADSAYLDLMARRLVRMQTLVLISYLLLRDAKNAPERICICERFIGEYLPEITRQHQTVMAGDRGCIAQAGEILEL